MALYITIGRFRRAGLDAPTVRKEAQELLDYFKAWTPPDDVTLVVVGWLWAAVSPLPCGTPAAMRHFRPSPLGSCRGSMSRSRRCSTLRKELPLRPQEVCSN
jgi:hypothetical protein